MAVVALESRVRDLESRLGASSVDLPALKVELVAVKIALTQLPGLQPDAAVGEEVLRELAVARRAYEVAVRISVMDHDLDALEGHIANLKPFYFDHYSTLGRSSDQSFILGLNLLRLLAQNRIAEFHTELELLTDEIRQDPCVVFARKLETYVQEGSYSKIIECRGSVPHPLVGHFLDILMETIRDEAADCCERAYTWLPAPYARRLLLIEDPASFESYASSLRWSLTPSGRVEFNRLDDEKPSLDEAVPPFLLMCRYLDYARELERII